jgi:hypothetical protein
MALQQAAGAMAGWMDGGPDGLVAFLGGVAALSQFVSHYPLTMQSLAGVGQQQEQQQQQEEEQQKQQYGHGRRL